MVDRSAEVLARQLMAWPTADRARLAELLLASLEPSDSDNAVGWETEIIRRAQELDGGALQGIPAAQVFAELDRLLSA